jgi:aspartyl protease family protein
VIGWALRWVLLCGVIALLVGGLFDRGLAVLKELVAQSPTDKPATSTPQTNAPAANTIVYPANQQGHVVIEAAVNGAPVRFLVDTGASLVTLTLDDARAAGISPRELVFSHRVNTANGSVRMAPIILREIRIDQFSVYDVKAAVLENLNTSLLGMSFLGQLQSYEMRDGKLTISW